MATINATHNAAGVHTYAGAATGDTFAPLGLGFFTAGSIQAEGLGDSTLALHGSNDGVNFYALSDLSGVAIAMTADGLTQFTAAVAFVKPALTGGTDAAVDVSVRLLA